MIFVGHVSNGLQVGRCRRRHGLWFRCPSFRLRHQHELLNDLVTDRSRIGLRTSDFRLWTSSPSPRLEVLAEQASAYGVELELHEQALQLLLVGRLHLDRKSTRLN